MPRFTLIPEDIGHVLVICHESRWFNFCQIDFRGNRNDMSLRLYPGGNFVCCCFLRDYEHSIGYWDEIDGQDSVQFTSVPTGMEDLYVIVQTCHPDIEEEMEDEDDRDYVPPSVPPTQSPLTLREWSSAYLLLNGVDRVAMENVFPTYADGAMRVATRRLFMRNIEYEEVFVCPYDYHDWAHYLSTYRGVYDE